jgi:S-adenosylmethionine synthetase
MLCFNGSTKPAWGVGFAPASETERMAIKTEQDQKSNTSSGGCAEVSGRDCLVMADRTARREDKTY